MYLAFIYNILFLQLRDKPLDFDGVVLEFLKSRYAPLCIPSLQNNSFSLKRLYNTIDLTVEFLLLISVL